MSIGYGNTTEIFYQWVSQTMYEEATVAPELKKCGNCHRRVQQIVARRKRRGVEKKIQKLAKVYIFKNFLAATDSKKQPECLRKIIRQLKNLRKPNQLVG
jgi:recombinational DNA repair protein (RecF pathway)